MKKNLFFAVTASILYSASVAQVQVSKEPRHHNIFENGHVRILDVHIPPGDTTQIHVHSTPSVFLILTNNVKAGSQVISEEKRMKLNTADDDNIFFDGFYTQPRIHRVWNSDTLEYHVMDIELTNKNYIILDSPIRWQDAFTLLFDEKPVRAYRVNLQANSSIVLRERTSDILIVLLTDSAGSFHVNGKSLSKKGDYNYIQSGIDIRMNNDAKDKTEFAFFELK